MSNQQVTARLKQAKNIRLTVISILVTIAVFLGLFLNKMLTPPPMNAAQLRENGIVLFEQPRLVKDFTLMDQAGQPFTKEQLFGHYSLVFFGFTRCPEICPMTMSELVRVRDLMRDDGASTENFKAMLVTLDPARDDAESLKSYLAYFDKDLIGLTGDFRQIMGLSNNVNVAFNKISLEDDYTIDHTSHVVILNTRGDYIGFIRQPMDVVKIAQSLQILPSLLEH